MKILVISQRYWPEPFQVTGLCENLVKKGHEVDVLTGIAQDPQRQFYEGYSWKHLRRQTHNGVNIIRTIETQRKRNSNFRIILNFVTWPIFANMYLRFHTQNYDCILTYEVSPVMVIKPGDSLAKRKKIPLCVYVLDFWPDSLFSALKIKSRLLRRLVTNYSLALYRKANSFIIPWQGLKNRLAHFSLQIDRPILYAPQLFSLPSSPSRISVTPNRNIEKSQSYAESALTNPVSRHRKSQRLDQLNLTFIGNINPNQDFPTIIDCAQILADRKAGVHFTIIGDGMSRKEAEDSIQARKLSKYFTFVGAKTSEELIKYQKSADILLVCARDDPMYEYAIPGKVYNYVALGKPIVAAMNGASQTLINQQSKSGICVNSGNSQGLAEAICDFQAMSTSELTQYGNNGLKYAHKHWDPQATVDQIEQFLMDQVAPLVTPIVSKFG
jgi:glycosyltransferase involved in cell wall biosynthesis